jgi:hypothetical protein
MLVYVYIYTAIVTWILIVHVVYNRLPLRPFTVWDTLDNRTENGHIPWLFWLPLLSSHITVLAVPNPNSKWTACMQFTDQ